MECFGNDLQVHKLRSKILISKIPVIILLKTPTAGITIALPNWKSEKFCILLDGGNGHRKI